MTLVGYALVATCLALPSVALSAPAAQLVEGDAPVSLHTSFDHYWRRYLLAENSGDLETAKRMLEEIERLRVERNAFNLHDVAMAFVYQGFADLEGGSFEDARTNFETARRLDPDLPTVYWGLARLSQREGGAGLVTAVVYRLLAHIEALRSTQNGPFASWNLVYVLFWTFWFVFFVFALVMVYRYGVLLYHDVEERFSDHLGSKALLALSLGILLFPLMLTAGFGWLAPYWLAVTFGYQSVKERVFSILSLLVLLASAPFADLYVAWVRTASNPLYQASLSSVTGTFDLADVQTLREAAHQYPADRDLQYLLATQYKNLGDYELAASQYRSLIERDPSDTDAHVNLGNIYFAQRDWDGALVKYDEVLAGAGSANAMAFYNKSLAHAENFQFGERGDARARAESYDASAVSAHERRTGDYRVVADARLDEIDILKKFYGLSEGIHDERVASFFDGSIVEGWGFRFVVGPILLGVLIISLEVGFKDRRLIQRCRKCGSAFCGRCQIGTGRKGVCTQCHHLFFMKDGVSAAARNEKLAQVQKDGTRRALVFRVLSIVAPGAGHIGEGMPLVGTTLLFFWVLGGAILLLGGTLYPLPDGLFGFGTSVPVLLLGMMLVALVLANVVARPAGRG